MTRYSPIVSSIHSCYNYNIMNIRNITKTGDKIMNKTSYFVKVTVKGSDEVLVSDIPDTKNVVKIYDENAFIYTTKGERFSIRARDLGEFIKNCSWCYGTSNYPSTLLPIKDLPEICEKYGLDFEAFGIGKEYVEIMKVQGNKRYMKRQVKVYLHRYVMGFYDPQKRKEMKKKYKDALKQYGLKSVDELEVDHDMTISKSGKQKKVYHYSDLMRICPHKVHQGFKVPFSNYQYAFPIFKNEELGLFELHLKESLSPFAKTIGKIIDSDVFAVNVAALHKKILKKYSDYYVCRKIKHLQDHPEVSDSEKYEYLRTLDAELRQELLDMAKELEEQGIVKVELFA
jgi:hypothetical protein